MLGWRRLSRRPWRRRVRWVLGAREYAVIGTYDDTCDSLFWGIADVRESRNPKHVNEATKDDPYVYYNIVRDEVRKFRRERANSGIQNCKMRLTDRMPLQNTVATSP